MTAKELAALLNISPATVSMVLNNRPGISEKTRKLVLDAADQYGCEPKKSSASPESSTMPVVYIIYKKSGHIVGDTPFFEKMTEGITLACQAAEVSLQIVYVLENQDIRSQLEYIRSLAPRGIVVLGTEMQPEDIRPFCDLHMPMVVLDRNFEALQIDSVTISNTNGAAQAVDYLFSHGFTNIGYLKSSYDIQNFREREEGYLKASRAHGADPDPQHILSVSPTAEQCYLDLKALLTEGYQPTPAYFADNDIIALSAVRAFRECGYRIPEDISVIGFDDIPACCYVSPTLTTVCVDKEALGRLAVLRLLEKIKYKDPAAVGISLYTMLAERESVFIQESVSG